jgi:hypothetical protein
VIDARPLLTVAYSTMVDRVHRLSIEVLEPDTDVLICLQGGEIPPDLPLAGARIVESLGRGVARSRNLSIDHALGRYLLFCDDDVTVLPAGVARGIRHLQRTGHAIALGQGLSPTGAPRKNYPSKVTRLTLFNSAKAATYEMLVDVEQIRAHGLRFDESFGAGERHYLGDEYIFISDLLRAGLRGDAVPLAFGIHPHDSSGSRWGTHDGAARAAVINRVFGRLAPTVRLAFALKHRVRLGGWRQLARFVAHRRLHDMSG